LGDTLGVVVAQQLRYSLFKILRTFLQYFLDEFVASRTDEAEQEKEETSPIAASKMFEPSIVNPFHAYSTRRAGSSLQGEGPPDSGQRAQELPHYAIPRIVRRFFSGETQHTAAVFVG
jgi:hypothetical protein